MPTTTRIRRGIMEQTQQKPVVVFTNSDLPSDPEVPYKHLGNAALVGLLSAIVGISIFFLFLCKDYPTAKGISPIAQIGHFWNFLFGFIFKVAQWDGFNYNRNIFHEAAQQGLGNWLLLRWIGSIVLGLAAGFWGGKLAFGIKTSSIHISGKKLRLFKEAYDDLAVLMAPPKDPELLKRHPSGLVLAVDPSAQVGYDPRTMTVENLTKRKIPFIELPEQLRRVHSAKIGGTGRGKSQAEIQAEFMQVYSLMKRAGKKNKRKMMVVDTPKSDYSVLVSNTSPFVAKIAPHESDPTCVIWDIPTDLASKGEAYQFWKGRISVSEKDPMWGKSAIALGTGCTYALQMMCPKAWNFGMLTYILGKEPQTLRAIFPKTYFETRQTFGGAEQTLGGMMQNLASELPDLVALANYWDGFDMKMAVFQSTAKALTFPDYLEYILRDMTKGNMADIFTPREAAEFARHIEDRNKAAREAAEKQVKELNSKLEPDKTPITVDEIFTDYLDIQDFSETRLLFKSTCNHLTSQKTKHNDKGEVIETWTWKDFDELITKPLNELKIELAKTVQDKTDLEDLANISEAPFYWTWLCSRIHFYHEQWDTIEGKPRFSIGEWWMSPQVDKPLLFLKPCEATDYLTTGLIKGILYYTNSVILGRLEDDPFRKWNIIIDELASYGKLDFFVKSALEKYRSRGISLTLAFQDLSQMDEIYDRHFVPFLTGNMGAIYIYGFNASDTSDRMSKLVGQREVREKTRNITYGDGKKSVNEGWQTVKKDVMTPDKFNTLLGAKDSEGVVNFLFLGNKLPDAYILQIKIINYERKSTPNIKLLENYREPPIPSITEIWNPKPIEQVAVRELEAA